MALAFRTGADAIAAAAERSGSGRFMPTMKWESGETKYIQFITPIEEVPTVQFHNFIVVGYKEDGKPIYESFISRRDKALDGPEGYDPLVTRFGLKPTDRCIGLAVELEPITEQQGARKAIVGFDVATRQFERDGATVTVPAVQLVIQSPSIFWGWLGTFSQMKPIESAIFAVTRKGKTTDTRYDFIEVTGVGVEPLDLDGILDEVGFDFNGYLENLADEQRVHDLIDPLPDDFPVNPYAKKDKAAAGRNTGRSTRTPAPTNEEPAAAATAEAATPTRSTRSRRFGSLEQELGESAG